MPAFVHVTHSYESQSPHEDLQWVPRPSITLSNIIDVLLQFSIYDGEISRISDEDCIIEHHDTSGTIVFRLQSTYYPNCSHVIHQAPGGEMTLEINQARDMSSEMLAMCMQNQNFLNVSIL